MQESIEYLETLNLDKNDYIIVGCSGGPDSMCLLDILVSSSYKVVVAHVNHNIRKESKDEYTFLKDYCQKRHIKFEGLIIPPYEDKNESFYRKERYTFYKDLCQKYKTNILMTAHHGDDLIETILMRITRGSTLKGYLGFKKDYDEYGIRIIKPLIFYNKDEILSYDEANKIPYVLDKTNEMDIYTRNRYRHRVLPFLKKENARIHKKYLHFSEELVDATEYIDRVLENALNENYKDGVVDIKKFMGLDEYIKKKELEQILKDIYRDGADKLKGTSIAKIISQLKKGTNFKLNFPLGIVVQREYDKLHFTKTKTDKEKIDLEFSNYIDLQNGYNIEKIEKSQDTSNYTIRLNSEDIHLPLHIRTRRVGDRMQVKNMDNYKKISKIMIDEKVEPSVRDSYPILVDDEDNILWLPGLKKSKFDSELYEKYDIILKYAKKGDTKHEEKQFK